MPSESDRLEDRKGLVVRLKGSANSKYKKRTGAYLDTGKASTNCYHYVIIELPNTVGNGTYLVSRRVEKSSVVLGTDNRPTNYAEAAFQQVPQLQERLDSLCIMLAKCRVNKSDHLRVIIERALDAAYAKQLSKGTSGEYRLIDESEIDPVASISDDEGGSV